MFSMKYTSPKLTPKKGRDGALHPPPSPSPLCVAPDSPSPSLQLPFVSLDRAPAAGGTTSQILVHSDDGNTDRSKIENDIDETVMHQNAPQSKVESYIDDVESSAEETTNDSSQLVLSTSTSLVGITLSSNNHSEHPFGNRESSDGGDHDVPTLEADNTNDCTRDDVANIDVDFDGMNYSSDGIQSAHSSAIQLCDVHSLPESMGAHFGYQRSISMEPMLHALPDESTSSLRADTSSRMTSRELSYHDARYTLPWQEGGDTNPSSPMVYDLSARPIASTTMTPGHDPLSMGSPYSGTTESDIGGDAYFDEPCRRRRNYEIKPRRDSIDEDSMLPPPRVNRTTSNEYATTNQISMPFLPGSFPPADASSSPSARAFLEPYPIPPPRQPFSHTHSLLDDCSDDEEDGASSFFIVNSPMRRAAQTYSCFPNSMVRGDSMIENGNHNTISHSATGISNASLKASNNIQQALLQTRHRRWDCQSTLAGSHAQSKEILDLSHRCYCVARYLPENTERIASSVRLSVSVEAIQAAVLASGLWRTVRCVRLPQGLFWSQMHESDDIWAILKMLNSIFPILNQIDFSGEIECASTSRRNEIVSGIMECLPNVAAIDGFVVEQLVIGSDCQSTDKSTTTKSEEEDDSQKGATNIDGKKRQSQTSDAIYHAAQACGECEPVPMCGLSNLVDSEALNGILDADPMDGDLRSNRSEMSNRSETLSVYEANSSLHANEGSLDRNISLEHVQVPTQLELQSEQRVAQDASSRDLSDDEGSKLPHISSSSSLTLSSSHSWGSNGSIGRGSRPPPCPNSASATRQHPRLPTMPKGPSSIRKAGNRLKRRVLGLMPTVSIMDEDDDEEDDDDYENSEGSDNDADRHADIL